MTFFQKLNLKKNLFLCIGLDPDYQKIPSSIKKNTSPPSAIFRFNKKIINATNDLICAYKINSAFYEKWGSIGIAALKKTIDFVHKNYPDIPVILDAKRGDIGNTNKAYADFIFDYLGVDALTLHPYLGKESLKPFLKRKNKGLFILVKTSNLSSGEFQDLVITHKKLDKIPLYQAVAYNVTYHWNKNKNCGLVVGATYPKQLKKIRKIAPSIPILIPGIGTQGGDLAKTIKYGLNNKNQGIIINVSRSIIFASKNSNFDKIARAKAKKINEDIKKTLAVK